MNRRAFFGLPFAALLKGKPAAAPAPVVEIPLVVHHERITASFINQLISQVNRSSEHIQRLRAALER